MTPSKVKPGAKEAKPIRVRKGGKVAAVLAGGNPRIAKADGDAPVQAYVAAMPGWKRSIGKQIDALIVRNVPHVRKAVKWNSPFYGIEGQGWFLSFHVYTRHVKVAFFRGTSLRPVPPGTSKHKNVRYVDIHEGNELDEARMATWVRQAARVTRLGPVIHYDRRRKLKKGRKPMIRFKNISRLTVGIVALVGSMVAVAHAAPPASVDEAAIRAQTANWEKAYNGGDAKGVAAGPQGPGQSSSLIRRPMSESPATWAGNRVDTR